VTVTYILSNCLQVTGLPLELKQLYQQHCYYDLTGYRDDDINELRLYKELPEGSIQIPRGLESHLLGQLQHRGIPVHRTLDVGEGSPCEYEINPKLDYTSGLYYYQGPATDQLLQYNTGRLQVSPGGGKTVCACLSFAKSNDGPVLFLADTNNLLDQFIRTAMFVFQIPRDKIGILQECHVSSAYTYRNILLSLAPKRLYGLSATPHHYNNDHLTRLMEDMLGPVVSRVRDDQIPERLTPEVFSRETGRQYYFIQTEGQPKWRVDKARHRVKEEIKNDTTRNKMIVRDGSILINMGHKLLITVDRVEHGKILTDMFSEVGINLSFPYKRCKKKDKNGNKIDGWTVNQKRVSEDVDGIVSGEFQGMIGTYKLFGKGYDCPALSAVLKAAPYSGQNTTQAEQVVGRIQRHYFDKDSGVVIDYVDDSQPNNELRSWAEGRKGFYLTKYGNCDTIK
jgi:superfamily II DNA or RNA helicase